LDPKIVMHRLSAETYREITVAPEWSVDKRGVHNAIVNALARRDTWQGKHFTEHGITNLGDACCQGAAL
jgi:radical SAM superfamily enzyme